MNDAATILVVDDDEDTIATISTWLKGKGFQVVTAGTGVPTSGLILGVP